MLFEVALELLEILIEHVLAAQFVVAPEVVDFGGGRHPVLLIDPVHLLLLAPYEVPVFALRLLPLPVRETPIHTVPERRLKLDVRPALHSFYGWLG